MGRGVNVWGRLVLGAVVKPFAETAGSQLRTAELRALARALRARLLLHRDCGIVEYPVVAPPRLGPKAQTCPDPGMVSAPGATLRSPGLPAGKTGPPKGPQPGAWACGPEQAAVVPEQLRGLQAEVLACRRCPLAAARRVPGQGRVGAAFMVVGDFAVLPPQGQQEQPLCFGLEEDVMLWNMMGNVLHLGPESVYVSNVLKCPPAPGQVPADLCLQQCRAHLLAEIALLRPALICAMGELAARTLLATKEPVARLRGGRAHALKIGDGAMSALPVMVTYHPRFLLQQPLLKRAALEDLQAMQARLQRGGRR